ncbi:MAG TPA: glycosyltransferase [Actinomycetaceae bacterium]|nr:glycosyltransferase [Actinomycetaceae bacterium]
MKILVFNVAAESAGALSILNSAHNAAFRTDDHEWLFIVSTPTLEEAPQLRVKRFPWVKKSWLHRLWFDAFMAPRIVRAEQPHAVVSLQNVSIPRVRQRQIVYLHTALPFSSYRFDLRKEPGAWLYQRLITQLIRRSTASANEIVVQAPWMSRTISDISGIEQSRIEVIRPVVSQSGPSERYRPTPDNRRRFFFPAGAISYKNHELIFAAAEQLQREGTHVEIVCTITHEDLRSLGITRTPGNVQLLGEIPFHEVQRRYTESVLVFPSLLETVGLPLMEAQAQQTFVLAADLPYARDATAGYDNAHFFDPHVPGELAAMMTSVANGSLPYSTAAAPPASQQSDPWDAFISLVTDS